MDVIKAQEELMAALSKPENIKKLDLPLWEILSALEEYLNAGQVNENS